MTDMKKALNAYTQAGADREKALKRELMARLPARAPRRSGLGRLAAVAAAVMVVLSLASFTPPGRALAAAVGERVMGLIETVFPPREVTVAPEGETENPVHMPHGDEPSAAPADPESTEDPAEVDIVPGYVIYVDEEIYTTAETENRMEITPLDPPAILGDDREPVPACMLTVEHRPELAFDAAEEAVTEELSERCTDIAPVEGPEGEVRLSGQDGLAWDSLCVDVRIVDDGQGGVYVLTAQYFMEAAEGHGTRFAAMMDTFRLVL